MEAANELMEVFSARLRNARKMRCLSYRGLSEAMSGQISPTALEKYEKGRMFPSSSAVVMLSSALGVRIDDLFRPFSVKIDMGDIKYRKRSSIGKKELEAINLKVADHLEKYIEVERMCGENKEFSIVFPEIVVHNEDDACAVASRFRETFKMGYAPISSPIEVLESAGAKIVELDDVSEKFDGDNFTTEGAFVIVLNRSFISERKRLSLFHETGHKVMSFAEGADEERLCTVFANEVLLPSEVFRKLVGNKRGDISLEELKDIQAQYGISIEAMMVKAMQAGIISKNRYQTFCIKVRSDKEFQKKVRASIYPEENSCRYNRLVFRLLANEEITESKCASLLGCSVQEVRERLTLL